MAMLFTNSAPTAQDLTSESEAVTCQLNLPHHHAIIHPPIVSLPLVIVLFLTFSVLFTFSSSQQWKRRSSGEEAEGYGRDGDHRRRMCRCQCGLPPGQSRTEGCGASGEVRAYCRIHLACRRFIKRIKQFCINTLWKT